MRKAFDHADAIKRFPDRLRAASLCASHRQLLVGTTEGSLLHFSRDQAVFGSARGFSSEDQSMSEIARHRHFAPEKQAVLALIAVPSWNPKDGGLLLALSSSSITAHTLGRLQGTDAKTGSVSAGQTLIASLPWAQAWTQAQAQVQTQAQARAQVQRAGADARASAGAGTGAGSTLPEKHCPQRITCNINLS